MDSGNGNDGSGQPSTSQNPPDSRPTNFRVAVIPPNPFTVHVYVPSCSRVIGQGYQVMRLQLPENANQGPPGMLRPPMVNQLPVVHWPGYSWPFVYGPGIGQPINNPGFPPVYHRYTQYSPVDVRYLNLDGIIATIPRVPLLGHGHSLRLIEHYRQQWLTGYQGVMNQIAQLQQSLVALKTQETCLFTPLNSMLEKQFNELPELQRNSNADVYQAYRNSLQNRIHNSGASDIVGLHTLCIQTSLNCMLKFLTPGNSAAPPPPGAGVVVPKNPPGLHMPPH